MMSQAKVTDTVALHLRCIEADLRDYLMNPAEYTVEYIEDIHILLLEIMYRLDVTPTSEEGEVAE